MIALDTNVLVRLLVTDDPAQAELARALVEREAARGGACLVTIPVLCELEWVLESCYQASRSDLLTAVQGLLSSPAFTFEQPEVVRQAIERYRQSKAELSDLLIGRLASALGAADVYTFDRRASREPGFLLLA